MTEPNAGVSAGQLMIDVMRTLSPGELELLGQLARANVDAMRDHDDTVQLAEMFNVLAIASDHLLSEHPAVLTDVDLADLELLGDATPEANAGDV